MQTLPPQTFTPWVFLPQDQTQGFLRIGLYVYPVFGITQLVQHSQMHEQGWVIFWVVLVTLYYFLIIYLAEQRTRLIVMPDGVIYLVGNAVLSAPWDDMDHIVPPPGPHWRGTEGIYLRQGQWRGRRFVRERGEHGYIPLRSGRHPYWERGAYETLGEHVPWLFEGG